MEGAARRIPASMTYMACRWKTGATLPSSKFYSSADSIPDGLGEIPKLLYADARTIRSDGYTALANRVLDSIRPCPDELVRGTAREHLSDAVPHVFALAPESRNDLERITSKSQATIGVLNRGDLRGI